MVRQYSEREVEPQAADHDRTESFNIPLFKKLGELGLLGVTVEERFGGSGLDATAAVIAHEELAAVDPGFTLAYLAHSMLFANNLAQNGSVAQRERYCFRNYPHASLHTSGVGGFDAAASFEDISRNWRSHVL